MLVKAATGDLPLPEHQIPDAYMRRFDMYNSDCEFTKGFGLAMEYNLRGFF